MGKLFEIDNEGNIDLKGAKWRVDTLDVLGNKKGAIVINNRIAGGFQNYFGAYGFDFLMLIGDPGITFDISINGLCDDCKLSKDGDYHITNKYLKFDSSNSTWSLVDASIDLPTLSDDKFQIFLIWPKIKRISAGSISKNVDFLNADLNKIFSKIDYYSDEIYNPCITYIVKSYYAIYVISGYMLSKPVKLWLLPLPHPIGEVADALSKP